MFRSIITFFRCKRTNHILLEDSPEKLLEAVKAETNYRQRYFLFLTLLSGTVSFTTTFLGFGLLSKHLRAKISEISNEKDARANPDNWSLSGNECSDTIIETYNMEYPENETLNLNMCFNWMDQTARNNFYALLSDQCAQYCKYLRSLTLSHQGHQAFLYFFLPLATVFLIKKEANYFFNTLKYYYHYNEHAPLTDLSPALYEKINQFLNTLYDGPHEITLKDLQNILNEEVSNIENNDVSDIKISIN